MLHFLLLSRASLDATDSAFLIVVVCFMLIFLLSAAMFSYAPNKTNIDEANKHLQLLTERVVELEDALHEKEEAAAKREEEMKAYVNVSHFHKKSCLQNCSSSTGSGPCVGILSNNFLFQS